MARPYSHGELLKLRESPLVCKPANLPPVEEWMGQVQFYHHYNDIILTYTSGPSLIRTKIKLKIREGQATKAGMKSLSRMKVPQADDRPLKRRLNQQMVYIQSKLRTVSFADLNALQPPKTSSLALQKQHLLPLLATGLPTRLLIRHIDQASVIMMTLQPRPIVTVLETGTPRMVKEIQTIAVIQELDLIRTGGA